MTGEGKERKVTAFSSRPDSGRARFVKQTKLKHTILRAKDGKREIAKLIGTAIGATIAKNLDCTREGDASK